MNELLNLLKQIKQWNDGDIDSCESTSEGNVLLDIDTAKVREEVIHQALTLIRNMKSCAPAVTKSSKPGKK